MILALRHDSDLAEQVIAKLILVKHIHVQLTSASSLRSSILIGFLAHLEFFQNMHNDFLVVSVKLAHTFLNNSVIRDIMFAIGEILIKYLRTEEFVKTIHNFRVRKNDVLKNSIRQFIHEDLASLIDQFLLTLAEIAVSYRLRFTVIFFRSIATRTVLIAARIVFVFRLSLILRIFSISTV